MNYLVALALVVALAPTAEGQGLSATAWRMHKGGGPVKLAKAQGYNGDPNAYSVMNIPASHDADWFKAPLDAKGEVFLKESSSVQCRAYADFTYFETKVFVPNNYTVTKMAVQYRNVDDGARAFIFNSKYPEGTKEGNYVPGADLVFKKPSTGDADMRGLIVQGEENRIVIAQFDDCANQNNVQGITISFNGTPVVTNTALPSPLSMMTYSIFGHLRKAGESAANEYYLFPEPNAKFGEIGKIGQGKATKLEVTVRGNGNMILSTTDGRYLSFIPRPPELQQNIPTFKFLAVFTKDAGKAEEFSQMGPTVPVCTGNVKATPNAPCLSAANRTEWMTLQAVNGDKKGLLLRHESYYVGLVSADAWKTPINGASAELYQAVFKGDTSWRFRNEAK